MILEQVGELCTYSLRKRRGRPPVIRCDPHMWSGIDHDRRPIATSSETGLNTRIAAQRADSHVRSSATTSPNLGQPADGSSLESEPAANLIGSTSFCPTDIHEPKRMKVSELLDPGPGGLSRETHRSPLNLQGSSTDHDSFANTSDPSEASRIVHDWS
jgi:hypothetical protein